MTNRTKTDTTHGTFRDIPKQFRTKRVRQKKKYIYFAEDRKYRILAYSIKDIREHFNLEKGKIERNIMMVDSFNDLPYDLNLCH